MHKYTDKIVLDIDPLVKPDGAMLDEVVKDARQARRYHFAHSNWDLCVKGSRTTMHLTNTEWRHWDPEDTEKFKRDFANTKFHLIMIPAGMSEQHKAMLGEILAIGGTIVTKE